MYVCIYSIYSFLKKGNGIGDRCDPDFDQDGDAITDVCPENPNIQNTNFTEYDHIMLDPKGTSQVDPEWEVLNEVLNPTLTKYFYKECTVSLIPKLSLVFGENIMFPSIAHKDV